MFDIGFGELLLIAVVALVVLGPERLPKAARFAGLWVRRARNQWDSVKQELERELHAEELKRNLKDVRASMQQAETELRDSNRQLQQGADQLLQQVADNGDTAVATNVTTPSPAALGGDENVVGQAAPSERDPAAVAVTEPSPSPIKPDASQESVR